MEPDDLAVLSEVATATRLHEGEAGVLRVLAALGGGERIPTNVVARTARLPVPLAAAVLGELRERGLVDGLRPAGLTESGQALVRELAVERVELPESLREVVEELQAIVDDGPDVDLTLDQAFATAETKVRRVLAMARAGTLPTPHLLAIGDDDLITVAIDRVQRALDVRLVGRVSVVDVSEPVLDAIGRACTTTRVDLVPHDLRRPLPHGVRASATAAMTDPPYTTHGARLFLARALEGLRPGPGWDVWLHFGHKPAAVAAQVQATLGELGLVVRSLEPGFSRYDGAGVIGGASDAWRLETTGAAVAEGEWDGPLYTADLRTRPREYRCHGCGATLLVGPRTDIASIGALKQTGCPTCGGTTFSPGRLAQT